MELNDKIQLGNINDKLHSMLRMGLSREEIESAFSKAEKDLLLKHFGDQISSANSSLEKGVKANIGETRNWNGKNFRKIAPGQWVEVTEHKLPKDHSSISGPVSPKAKMAQASIKRDLGFSTVNDIKISQENEDGSFRLTANTEDGLIGFDVDKNGVAKISGKDDKILTDKEVGIMTLDERQERIKEKAKEAEQAIKEYRKGYEKEIQDQYNKFNSELRAHEANAPTIANYDEATYKQYDADSKAWQVANSKIYDDHNAEITAIRDRNEAEISKMTGVMNALMEAYWNNTKEANAKEAASHEDPRYKEIDYNSVREWAGDDITNKDINDVFSSIQDEVSLPISEFKVSQGARRDQEIFYDAIHDKVTEIYSEVREGMWPARMDEDRVKEIINGIVMSVNM